MNSSNSTHFDTGDLVLEVLLVDARAQVDHTHKQRSAALLVHGVHIALGLQQDTQQFLQLPVGRDVQGDAAIPVRAGRANTILN